MPEKIDSGAIAQFGFNTPFAEQLAFFRQKLNLPSERWDDITKAAHDRAFIVAGAMKADLLEDLRGALDTVIADGKSLGWFRKEFAAIVGKRGWTGWTGEGTPEGFAWRTRVIYQTNLATSYAAGRYRQLTDPDLLKLRPYWRYKHADGVANPRLQHVAWNGLTLPHDHPFWQTHFPPNGWGCHCSVQAVSKRDYAQAGADGLAEPPEGWDTINPKTDAPAGISRGFDYAPGASVVDELRALVAAKAESLPQPLAAAEIHDLVISDAFQRWYEAPTGDFPVAVIPQADADRIGAKKLVAMFSAASHSKQLANHAELASTDYALVQEVIDQGESYQDAARSLIYVLDAPDGMTTVVKATATGEGLFLVSLRHLPTDDALRAKEIERIKRKAERYGK